MRYNLLIQTKGKIAQIGDTFMTSLQVAQGLIKSQKNFTDLMRPVLAYTSGRSGAYRAYTNLVLNENGGIESFYMGDSLESLLKTMNDSDEYKDAEIVSEDEFRAKERESLRKQYKVGTPTQVNKSRFWYMFETLPPCDYTRGDGVKSFRFEECLASDLYMFFFQIGHHYFEMVNHDGADLATMIAACNALEVVDMPDTDENED